MSIAFLSFPQRVYNVLKLCEEQGRQDIISWENNGTAFKVNDLDAFERDLLPRWFNTKKYYSFTRALYAHGFDCVRTGRQTGIYSHPRFNRNDPEGSSSIRRETRKKTAKTSAVPNSLIESLNNRHFELKSNTSNGKQTCQFPSLFDGMSHEDDAGLETVFGRLYHTVSSQVADRVTSESICVPSGSELLGVFDFENGSSMCPRWNPNSTPFTLSANVTFLNHVKSPSVPAKEFHGERNSIARSDSLLILGIEPMAPITTLSSSSTLIHGSEKSSLRECQASETWYTPNIIPL